MVLMVLLWDAQHRKKLSHLFLNSDEVKRQLFELRKTIRLGDAQRSIRRRDT